jgi:hypothetical protein
MIKIVKWFYRSFIFDGREPWSVWFTTRAVILVFAVWIAFKAFQYGIADTRIAILFRNNLDILWPSLIGGSVMLLAGAGVVVLVVFSFIRLIKQPHQGTHSV